MPPTGARRNEWPTKQHVVFTQHPKGSNKNILTYRHEDPNELENTEKEKYLRLIFSKDFKYLSN